MAIRSRRQTVAGGAPFCLQAQRSQGNPSHVWQHYKQSGRQDVNQGGPLSCLDLGGGVSKPGLCQVPWVRVKPWTDEPTQGNDMCKAVVSSSVSDVRTAAPQSQPEKSCRPGKEKGQGGAAFLSYVL